MKKFIAIFLILFSSNLFSADLLQEIKNRDVIRIGIHESALPFSYLNDKKEYSGIDIEIAKSIALDLLGDENKIEWLPVNNMDRIPILKNGKVDFVIANFTKTRNRAKSVDFSSPYSKASLSLIAHKDTKIHKLSDLDNQTVIVKKGSTAERFLTDSYPTIKLFPVDNDPDMFNALLKDEGKATVHDNILMWDWLKTHGDFEVKIPSISKVDFIAIGVNKNQEELLKYLNSHLSKMQKNGELEEIYKKIFKQFYTLDQVVEVIVLE